MYREPPDIRPFLRRKPTGSRMREPEELRHIPPVVTTEDRHFVDKGGNIRISFTYVACTPVTVQVFLNRSTTPTTKVLPPEGEIGVDVYDAQYQHHKNRYRATVTDLYGFSDTAVTELLVREYLPRN